MPTIGPELPPHLRARRSHSPTSTHGSQLPVHEEDSDDSDDYGPALPPHLLGSRSSKLEATPVSSLPQPSHKGGEIEDYEDSDEDVGPMPLPSNTGTSNTREDVVRNFMEAEERRRKEVEEAKKPKAPVRDEWMLVPPSASDLLGKLDTSKLMKPRQFSRSTAPSSSKVDNSLWTETPAERQQRLADEVSGKKRKATAVEDIQTPEEAAEAKRRRKRDEEIRRGVEEHTRKARGGALVESHKAKIKDKPSDDEPPAIWDHSRDMSLGGRLMDDNQRSKMLKDAKALGDRFGSGTNGGYL